MTDMQYSSAHDTNALRDTVVVRNRGIGEPDPGPTLCGITDLLPSDWTFLENPWLAQYGPAGEKREGTVPFLDAVHRGSDDLTAMVRDAIAADKRVVLLGYSGGAVVVHRTLDQLSTEERGDIAAVGFVSDPEQPRDVTGSTGRYGIRGESPAYGIPARWAADPDDGICLCPDNSPLRLLAQWTPDVGLDSPLAWRQQARRAVKLRRHPAYAIDVHDLDGEKARFAEARRLFDGYLGEDHISYGVRTEPGTGATYLENMASWLTEVLDPEAEPTAAPMALDAAM